MTEFEERLKDFLEEQGVIEELWQKSIKEAREELEEDWDLLETTKNIFQDLINDFIYEWVAEHVADNLIKELLEDAIDSIDLEDIINAVVVENQLNV
jgi:hypothetical protein